MSAFRFDDNKYLFENENNFDTKSISLLVNDNDDDYVIEDLLNYCYPPVSPTSATNFNHEESHAILCNTNHENQMNIVVSPTTYLLNPVEDTYDILDNDINAFNNISSPTAIYINHDTNYYPTKKAENSHNEEIRPVRKKLFSLTESENEENSKGSEQDVQFYQAIFEILKKNNM